MRKAIFFDRDGVINEAIWRGNKASGPRSLDEWQWVEGIHEAVTRLKAADYLIFVITNQPDIHRQVITRDLFDDFTQKLYDELGVDDVSACLHDDIHQCHCRKPKPGLILDLAKKWDISLSASALIGDTDRDLKAGKAAQIFSIILDRPYNQKLAPDLRVGALAEAVDYLLSDLFQTHS